MAVPSTIALSIDKLRADGYFPWKTETWNAFARIRQDLWGWCDVIAVGKSGILAVQATTWGEVSKRVRKIADSDSIGPVRDAGVSVQVWGWKKVGKTWQVRIEDIS
jgi:hypothetical protein